MSHRESHYPSGCHRLDSSREQREARWMRIGLTGSKRRSERASRGGRFESRRDFLTFSPFISHECSWAAPYKDVRVRPHAPTQVPVCSRERLKPAIAQGFAGFFILRCSGHYRSKLGQHWGQHGSASRPSHGVAPMPLTDTAIKNAKPAAKPTRLFDGRGLYLEFLLLAGSGGAA